MEWPPKNLITFLLGSHHASWMYHPASPSEPSPRKKMLKFRDLCKSGVIITEKSQWFWFFYSKMIALRFFFTNRIKTSLDPWFFFGDEKFTAPPRCKLLQGGSRLSLKKVGVSLLDTVQTVQTGVQTKRWGWGWPKETSFGNFLSRLCYKYGKSTSFVVHTCALPKKTLLLSILLLVQYGSL